MSGNLLTVKITGVVPDTEDYDAIVHREGVWQLNRYVLELIEARLNNLGIIDITIEEISE